jgi:hypothetical protein
MRHTLTQDTRNDSQARMNIKSTLFALVAAAITVTCSGQITATKSATSSHTLGTTNTFSSWKDHWTNLTVAAACPPWGCSVIYVGIDLRPPLPQKQREAMQQLAKRLEELKKEEQLRKLLNPPAMSDTYRISLARETNSIGQKP